MDRNLLNRITIEPGQCGGMPCLRGMRIRVTDILELLANGASFEEILADYPYLEREDILAAVAHAAQQTNYVVVDVSGPGDNSEVIGELDEIAHARSIAS